jgi:hypothetical protein
MARQKQHAATGGSLIIDWEGLAARFHQQGNNGARGNGIHPSDRADEAHLDEADGLAMPSSRSDLREHQSCNSRAGT